MAYEDLTVEELQERLRKLDQPVSGNKDELIERLQAAEGMVGPQAMEPQGSVVGRFAGDEDEDATGGTSFDYGAVELAEGEEEEPVGGLSFDYGDRVAAEE